MSNTFKENVLDRIQPVAEGLPEAREILLANLAMISEIPSPTFGEEKRVRFLQDRFSEFGLQNSSSDEIGNALGILNGEKGDRNILVVAHVDTPFKANIDHTLSMDTDRITGPGVGDNSLGVAVLASLPLILDYFDIKLDANLVLMGATRSIGRGNLEGLRFFLGNNDIPVHYGVCVEGVRQGRLSYSSLGMQRGEITCHVPGEYDWSRFGATGAVSIINQVISRISEIALPSQPMTTIIFGSVKAGGSSYSSIARDGVFRFEIRSESDDEVHRVARELENICGEISGMTRADVKLNIFSERKPGGLDYGHPLCNGVRAIMDSLDIEPRIRPSMSELSAFIDKSIPAVTLGITTGEDLNSQGETIFLEPVFRGVAQLVGTLMAIDGGYCDEPE